VGLKEKELPCGKPTITAVGVNGPTAGEPVVVEKPVVEEVETMVPEGREETTEVTPFFYAQVLQVAVVPD
jgi:hypothetical protein